MPIKFNSYLINMSPFVLFKFSIVNTLLNSEFRKSFLKLPVYICLYTYTHIYTYVTWITHKSWSISWMNYFVKKKKTVHIYYFSEVELECDFMKNILLRYQFMTRNYPFETIYLHSSCKQWRFHLQNSDSF